MKKKSAFPMGCIAVFYLKCKLPLKGLIFRWSKNAKQKKECSRRVQTFDCLEKQKKK